MPVVDGFAATKLDKADEFLLEIPVVALAEPGLRESEQDIRSVSNGYLLRPFERSDLMKEISRYLAHKTKEANAGDAPGFTETWDAAQVDAKTQAGSAQLLNELSQKRDRCKDLEETMTINEIDSFAEEIKELGHQYAYPPVSGWAEEVLSQSSTFDMDGLVRSLNGFESLQVDIERNLS